MTLPALIIVASVGRHTLLNGWPAPLTPALMALLAILLTGTALMAAASCARPAWPFPFAPLALRPQSPRQRPHATAAWRQFRPNLAGHSRPRAPSAGPAAA